MAVELTPKTDRGAHLVALAERLADVLATDAPSHDRAGSYPFAGIEALRDARFFAAPIPEALGGLGVDSVHDIVVASSRLARGDASVAIGVNMHLGALLNMVRRWRITKAAHNYARACELAESLAAFARDRVVMATAISEPGQDLTRPGTVATRTDGGWRVDGRKMFCTMSPAATQLLASVRYEDDRGVERYGYVIVPTGARGLTVNDDWDALGMRASGSHSVMFDGVLLPASALRGGFPAGAPVPYMQRNLAAGLFHGSASLGIAESALAGVVRTLGERQRGLDTAHTRMVTAQSTIDLSACRGALSRAASLLDEHHAAHPTGRVADDEVVALFSEIQATKTFVCDAAGRIVEQALGLSGGAGYLNGHPLARAYRDIRAGSFMHPLGANRAYELVAQVELGLEPQLH